MREGFSKEAYTECGNNICYILKLQLKFRKLLLLCALQRFVLIKVTTNIGSLTPSLNYTMQKGQEFCLATIKNFLSFISYCPAES